MSDDNSIELEDVDIGNNSNNVTINETDQEPAEKKSRVEKAQKLDKQPIKGISIILANFIFANLTY